MGLSTSRNSSPRGRAFHCAKTCQTILAIGGNLRLAEEVVVQTGSVHPLSVGDEDRGRSSGIEARTEDPWRDDREPAMRRTGPVRLRQSVPGGSAASASSALRLGRSGARCLRRRGRLGSGGGHFVLLCELRSHSHVHSVNDEGCHHMRRLQPPLSISSPHSPGGTVSRWNGARRGVGGRLIAASRGRGRAGQAGPLGVDAEAFAVRPDDRVTPHVLPVVAHRIEGCRGCGPFACLLALEVRDHLGG